MFARLGIAPSINYPKASPVRTDDPIPLIKSKGQGRNFAYQKKCVNLGLLTLL